MDIYNFSLKEFIDVLSTCKGEVFMVTDEGDRLNLKSTLSQLIGFSALIEGGTVAKAHIECSEKDDERKLIRFNLFGEIDNE